MEKQTQILGLRAIIEAINSNKIIDNTNTAELGANCGGDYPSQRFIL